MHARSKFHFGWRPYRSGHPDGRAAIREVVPIPALAVRGIGPTGCADRQQEASEAGFKSATLGGVDANDTRPTAIVEPIVDKSELTAPRAMFSSPNVYSPKLRPTVNVHRDGRIVIASQCLFEAKKGKAKHLKPLRKALRRLRA